MLKYMYKDDDIYLHNLSACFPKNSYLKPRFHASRSNREGEYGRI